MTVRIAKRILAFIFTLSLASALTVVLAFAQATSGDLVGTITDQSGAVVPNANITATNTETGVKNTTRSNVNGEYRFGNLPVGTYDITADETGFANSTVQNFRVELNKTATANLVLSVAGASTSVEVTAAPPAIDTTTSQLQTTFDQKQAQDLPTSSIGSGILNLALLSPGVANSGGIGAGQGPSVGGQRPRNNNFTIEGVDNNNKSVTGPLVFIPNDAVENFTVLQNQYSPEFGHSSGGQFNTVIRDGTNNFHGRLYEYFQNRNLDAIDAATARNGNTTNPRYDQNRLGFQIGGPVIKNKVFFFSNFEYNPAAYGISSQVCSPTAAGYAQLATIPGLSRNNLQVFQRFVPPGTIPDTNRVACAGGLTEPITSGAATVNVPVALRPVTGSTFTNGYYSTNSIDWNISDKDQLRGRWIYNRVDGLDSAASLPAFFQTEPQRFHVFTVSEYHAFTPNVGNEFRVGFNRFSQVVPAGNFSFPGLDQFPNITIDSLTVNVGPDGNAPQSTTQNTYQAVENLTWVRGNHNFKFGVEGRKYISPQSFTQRQRGDYEYGNFDRYLHDLSPDQFGERSTGNFFYYGDQTAIYAYAADNWRLTRNLSLNLGLRYEFTSVPTGERTQRLNAAASVPGLINFQEPSPQYGNFAPRIGFNYSPGTSGDTSIRGGYGIAYDVLYDNLGSLSFPPQFSGTQDVNTTVTKPNFLANGGLPPGTGGLQTFPTVQAQRAATAAFVPNQQLPYSENWNLGVQHVFAKTYTVEVRYLGSRGIHLPVQDRLNRQPVVGPDNFLPTFIDPTTVPSQAQLNTLKTLNQVQAFRSSFVPAFGAAGFSSNITSFEPFGSSIYHGLATSVTRHFEHGLQFNAAYTWSHLIDDSTADVFSTVLTPRRPQNPQNIALDRSTSALDRRHRFTLSTIYDLPFFKQSNWFTKNLVGNWEFAPIYTVESPEYATVQSELNSNLAGDSFSDRVIFNPGGVSGTGSGVSPLTNSQGQVVGYRANNPNAQYIVAGIGALANASRNTLALPRTNNWDLSIVKRFNVGEKRSVEFQGEAFNLLNHSQYVPGSVNQISAISLIGQPLNFTNTAVRNFLTPSSSTFNRPDLVFPDNARTLQLALKFIF